MVRDMSDTHGASNGLAVVILNWNAADDTLRTVRLLERWRSVNKEIVVVDNASEPENRAVLSSYSGVAMILYQSRNLGYAGGNNIGIRWALERGCEYVFLLNNDAQITEAATRTLLDAFRDHPNRGIVGPLIEEKTPDGSRWAAGGRNMALWPHTRRMIRNPSRLSSPFPTNYVPGTAALVRAEVFRKVGLFDERFFFSGEMADFCRRARVSGFECVVVPSARALHQKHAGSPTLSALHAYYTLRNRFLYVSIHGGRVRKLYHAYWFALGLIMKTRAAARGLSEMARALDLALRDARNERWGSRNELFLLERHCNHS